MSLLYVSQRGYGRVFNDISGSFQDMFQQRSRMSSAHEANTQRLMSALRDKETALKVRMVFTLGRFLFFTAASLLYVLQTTTTDSPHRGH